jgi:hypothetical protein
METVRISELFLCDAKSLLDDQQSHLHIHKDCLSDL